MGKLQDRVAVITGAGHTGGIGFAIARRFGHEGARLVLIDRAAEALEEAAEILGRDVRAFTADIRSTTDMKSAFDAIASQFGRVDVLVNNAGITQPRRTVDISTDDYDAIMDINLRGSLTAAQLSIPLMGRGASIVCIASIAGQRGGGLMGGPHYAASKAGLSGLARAMARDLAPDGIRVNAINPGVILTGMSRDFYDEERTRTVMQGIPLQRFGTPEDVASACLFLASDDASYITGTSLDVNGGLHMN